MHRNNFTYNLFIVHYSKKTVLIVDDSNLVVERLTEMLKELKNVDNIYSAGNFTDAINILQNTPPDILLLDINLPDTSGIELLRVVKNKYPAIMVTMVSNQSDRYYKELCRKLGADHFVDKSKNFDIIPDIISASYL